MYKTTAPMPNNTLRLITMRLLIVSALIFSTFCSFGAPAYPYPLNITQPNGSVITIRLYGDEYFNYATTSDGIPVVRKSDGYYYYASYSTKGISTTDQRASNPGSRSFVEKVALQNVERVTEFVATQMRSESTLSNLRISSLPMSYSTKAAASLPPQYLTKPLVILVNYTDVKFANGAKSSYENALNAKRAMPNISVADYFRENSMGVYNPQFDILGPVELPNNRAYYGKNNETTNNDERPYDMYIDACKMLAKQGVDLKKYDQNNDGYIDNAFIVFAGHNAAEGGGDDTVWPHSSDVSTLNSSIGGAKLGKYACTSEYRGANGSEKAGIGTFCHEFSHVLGLMDLYDTDYKDNGTANGIGAISLMGAGNYNNGGNTPPYLNILEREMLGWTTITEAEVGDITLEPIQKSNLGYKISTNTANEYYLIECRNSTGLDQYTDATAQGKGLAIYHVDRSINSVDKYVAKELWSKNLINAFANHECMRLVAADNSGYTYYSGVFFPGTKNKTEFSSLSNPKLIAWNDQALLREIVNIAWNGTASTLNIQPRTASYSLWGSIMNDNKPLSGVTIKLTPYVQNNTKTQQYSIINFMQYTKAAADEKIIVTNDKGEYKFENIRYGKYTLTAFKYGFLPYSSVIDLNNNEELQQINLIATQTALMTAVSHTNGPITSMLSGSTQGLRVAWSPQMISAKNLANQPISYITWHTLAPPMEAIAQIYFDDKVVFSTKLITNVGLNIIPVTNDLKVPSDKSLIIEYTYNTTTSTSICAIDNGPAVAGYGDLIKGAGSDKWNKLSDLGINSNLFITFWKEKNSQITDSPQIQISDIGQRHLKMTWGSSDGNILHWRVLITGTNHSFDEIADDCRLTVTGLSPNQTYQISIWPIINEVEGTVSQTTITTTKNTAPYAAISYKLLDNGSYLFTPVNLPDNAQVKWKFNDLEASNSYIYNVGNTSKTNTIKLIITYSDGRTETITRVIKGTSVQ